MWKPIAKNLRGSIFETVSWFSLFFYPMTALEIWQYLFERAEYTEVLHELEAMTREKQLFFKDGRYFLPGHETDVLESESRYRSSLKKLQIASRAAKYLSFFREVKAVFVCNSLALMQARPESDIDLFVIASHGSLWRVRFAAVLPYALIGARPDADSMQDTLCWSFFMSDSGFDLRRFSLNGDDPYLAFWGATLLPIFDPDSLVVKIREESGFHELFPQLELGEGKGLRAKGKGFSFHIPDIFEKPLRRFQESRFPPSIRNLIGKGSDVVVSDEALKFHTLDRRAEYRDRYLQILAQLGLKV